METVSSIFDGKNCIQVLLTLLKCISEGLIKTQTKLAQADKIVPEFLM